MHIPTAEEIRSARRRLGMTQADLARRSGISQSMVARIERGSVDPRVSTLQRIVLVLTAAELPVVTAGSVMHSPVECVSPDDTILAAVEKMDRMAFSQIPVLQDGVPVGCISEGAILSALGEQRHQKGYHPTVRDYMEASFPTVPPEIEIETVVGILEQHHAVLVMKGGRVEGVITKHDLISLIVG
ncbi:MAG: CBS domain-containing protein [Methanocalculus sp. MSAO_Arc1]|uniref:XRE family transcriptional regulator n=1 Tax=Methanocalculus TaxID=71151 RepID=UPI000FF77CA3|nr:MULTISPECIES: CBS domain-containing protein [unclassified Methanocalculus]MCP1661953.1 putative transcriptional regulator [Methanocalculus sp. AMF5]RQD80534.1 MAG: CBS domain-containing protein [Methanocalculus sp. MSAO_Arc1]